jgi:hypothetical protein
LALGASASLTSGQPPSSRPQLAGPKALGTPTALPLAHVDRAVAALAGIGAIPSEQPNSAVTAGAHEDRTVSAETRPDPHDPEPLKVAIASFDFEAGGGKPQIGKIGVFQADVGFVDLARITMNIAALPRSRPDAGVAQMFLLMPPDVAPIARWYARPA